MKKTKFFAFLCCMVAMFCCISFSSCGDKDDDDDDKGGSSSSSSSSSLIGTWKAVSGTYEEDGKTYNYEFNDEVWATIVFTDKTVTRSVSDGEDEDTKTGTYTLNGNQIIFPADEGEFTTTYSLSGDTLVITITDVEDGSKQVVTYKRQK